MKLTRIAMIASAAMLAAAANAFDWPAAGGTATIPAGETVTVTGNDVTTVAACGAIVIEAGATLKFSNITANADFRRRHLRLRHVQRRERERQDLPPHLHGRPLRLHGQFRLQVCVLDIQHGIERLGANQD